MSSNIIVFKNENNPDLVDLIKLGAIVKVQGSEGSALYKFVIVKPDNTIACQTIGQPLPGSCVVGGLLHIKWRTEKGICILPVKVTGLGGKGEIIVMAPIGDLEYEEEQDITKIKPISTVHLRLQIDGSNSRYNSIEVIELSSADIKATIFSRVPIDVGQEGRIEIDLYATQTRIPARGVITKSAVYSPNEYLIEIEFTEIVELEKQKLIEYLAWEQRTQADGAERIRQREKEDKEKAKQKLQKQKEKEKEKKKDKKKRQKEREKIDRQENKEDKPKKSKEKKAEEKSETPDKNTDEKAS